MKDPRQRRNFLIEYQCIDSNGKIIKSGKIRAKNKSSEFEALAGTEDHLKKMVPGMVKMKYTKIHDESLIDWLGNINEDLFGDLFGKK